MVAEIIALVYIMGICLQCQHRGNSLGDEKRRKRTQDLAAQKTKTVRLEGRKKKEHL